MNRAIYIVMVPVLLVALGYILVFRSVGLAPGYARLLFAMSVFVVAIWWLAGKTARARSGRE
jgi:ABC-type spermidine/putrescine transport system permease subunit II